MDCIGYCVPAWRDASLALRAACFSRSAAKSGVPPPGEVVKGTVGVTGVTAALGVAYKGVLAAAGVEAGVTGAADAGVDVA
jgi:hypothetical protein